MVAAPMDDGGTAHLVPGTRLPDIALPSSAGGKVDLRGERAAVVFIYPWTGRPGVADPPAGTTSRARTARRRRPRASATPTRASGNSASRCSGSAHRTSSISLSCVSRLGVPFPMLSDAAFRVQKALRLPTFERAERPT